MEHAKANSFSVSSGEIAKDLAVYNWILLQMEFPHGLYGVVIDCLVLYMEYNWDIMAFSKLWPWSLWMWARMVYA